MVGREARGCLTGHAHHVTVLLESQGSACRLPSPSVPCSTPQLPASVALGVQLRCAPVVPRSYSSVGGCHPVQALELPLGASPRIELPPVQPSAGGWRSPLPASLKLACPSAGPGFSPTPAPLPKGILSARLEARLLIPLRCARVSLGPCGQRAGSALPGNGLAKHLWSLFCWVVRGLVPERAVRMLFTASLHGTTQPPIRETHRFSLSWHAPYTRSTSLRIINHDRRSCRAMLGKRSPQTLPVKPPSRQEDTVEWKKPFPSSSCLFSRASAACVPAPQLLAAAASAPALELALQEDPCWDSQMEEWIEGTSGFACLDLGSPTEG